MRFEEWKKDQDDQFLCARHVWEAAQKIERDECCKAIDAIDDGEAPEYRACQEAIMARSNARNEGPALATVPLD